MTAPTTIEFKVTADTSQAQAAIGGLEDEFKKSTGAVSALDKRIEALTADMDELSIAIVKGGGNADVYRAELQRLGRQMDALDGSAERAKGSVGGLDVATTAAAKPMRNIGQAALEGSRALEDLQYGIGGVVNNIPSLVMALGGSAGLTAVISLAAVAGNQLFKVFSSVDEPVGKSVEEATKHLDKLRGTIEDLDRDLRGLAIGAGRAGEEGQSAIVIASEAERDRAVAIVGGLKSLNEMRELTDNAAGEVVENMLQTNAVGAVERAERAARGLASFTAKQYDDALAAQKKFEMESEVLRKMTAKRLFKIYQDDVKATEDEIEEERKRREKDAIASGKKNAEDIGKARYDQFVAHLDDEDRALDAVRKARRERAKKDAEEEARERAKEMIEAYRLFDKERKDADAARDRERNRATADAKRLAERGVRRQSTIEGTNLGDRLAFSTLQQTDPEIARINALTDHEFEALKMRRDNWAGFYEDIGSLGTEMFGGLITQTADLFNALAAGEDKAVENFAVNVMKNAGQSLVASGTKLAGESVVSFLTPGLQPLGAAQLAGAVGLVGAGVGLGASSSALSSVLGLGKGGDGAARDPGASPRTSDAGGGGGLVVNIAYGVTGPLPEDTAREVRAALEVEGRR